MIGGRKSKGASIREIRLFFWRRQGRGRRCNEGSARWQRSRPRGDDPHRPPRSGGLHNNDGVLRLLLEARPKISRIPARRGEEKSGTPRARHEEEARRREGPAPGECAVWLCTV